MAMLADLSSTTTFFEGGYTATSVTITIFCALALYNAVEILILIFTTFRRYTGLYFYSLVIASSGIVPYVIGFVCGYFRLVAQQVGITIATIGWPMMVTGQSLVLYSRLGIVAGANRDRLLKAIKHMVIVDGLVFHITTTVVMYGAYNAHPALHFALAYEYVEKVQMTAFTVQELIISGSYIWCTCDLFKTTKGTESGHRSRRRTMVELLCINAICIMFDIALLVVEYQNRHVIEQAMKPVVYSIKLKLEFAVLRKLIDTSQQHTRMSYDTFGMSTDAEVEGKFSQVSNGPCSTSIPRKNPKHSEYDGVIHVEMV